MSESETDSASYSKNRSRASRLTSHEIRKLIEYSEDEEGPYIASDEESYLPQLGGSYEEDSDIETENIIECEDEYDSDESSVEEHERTSVGNILTSKDGTQWYSESMQSSQTISRNILHQKGGPVSNSILFSEKELFKSIITPEICDIVLRETNRKAKRVTEAFNRKLVEMYPNPAKRPPQKNFQQFTSTELDAFLGILIATGVQRDNKTNIDDLWNVDALPLVRAAMSRDRFKMMLRFIRFDNENTREERIKSDKAAPIRDIWAMLNNNLEKSYKPLECVTVDEQLFPFRGRTRFTQYIPSKPAKYGIKIFWACDASTSYPLQGLIYTGKSQDDPRQKNVGETTVLELVKKYKGSGINVVTDNFFTSLELGRFLNSWNMTLVGTVRKNKKFLPSNMQPSKERPVNSTNFVYNTDATMCSYVPKKKNKSVILLSTMHMTGEVENTESAKPEIIKYYNKNKGGVDVMDKMLGEYTVKRRTLRWPLAIFYNMIDVAALAAYVIYREHHLNRKTKNQRRKFLKDLSNQLCLAAVEDRSQNKLIMRKYFLRSAVEMVLKRRVITAPVVEALGKEPYGSRRASPIVGRCYICQCQKRTQRKTRKLCNICMNPVCDEHSVKETKCCTCIATE